MLYAFIISLFISKAVTYPIEVLGPEYQTNYKNLNNASISGLFLLGILHFSLKDGICIICITLLRGDIETLYKIHKITYAGSVYSGTLKNVADRI